MFYADRLRQARRRRGLTKVALAAAVGLTPRRIAAFENEGETPPPAKIEALATALAFPVSFFARPAPRPLEVERVSFRSLTRLSASSRDAALAGAELATEVSGWIDERFDLPSADLPDLRDVQPGEAASVLRSMWALGEVPAPNMVHLLEAHGVRVFSLVDECAALDAVSAWINDRPYVFLTRHKTPERARWDAAHELGHLVQHLDAPPGGRVHEEQADQFAREFLLPERGVRARAARFPSLTDVRHQKVFWKVSALAYIRRLHQLGILTDWQYKSLVIEASQAGYRRKEGDIERETSQLIPKVMAALRAEATSVADVAAALHISSGDLRGLLFSQLGVVDGGQHRASPGRRAQLHVIGTEGT
jgi:Zn-dependent peptidase ImmA (M78 family)